MFDQTSNMLEECWTVFNFAYTPSNMFDEMTNQIIVFNHVIYVNKSKSRFQKITEINVEWSNDGCDQLMTFYTKIMNAYMSP